MASLTVRNLDDELKRLLRIRAAKNGRSMEQEVREILRQTLARDVTTPGNLATAIQARFAPTGGVELELPQRDPMRESPELGG